MRLGILASDAQRGLERVAQGEGDTIAGWIAYGAALNAGRALFHPDDDHPDDDKGFGQWLFSSKLEENVHPAEQSAAMWAARAPDEFEEARGAGNASIAGGVCAGSVVAHTTLVSPTRARG